MTAYSVNEKNNPTTGITEFIVVDSTGIKAPPPNTFATKDAALGRLAELLGANPPFPKMMCRGEIVAASESLLIQHLGRNQYVLHRRTDSEAFAEIDEDDFVLIVDGKVKYPERSRSLGQSL